MRETKPSVFLIARPVAIYNEMKAYLDDVGGSKWLDHTNETMDGVYAFRIEEIVEFAGRLCYKSWVPNLNPNVTKIRTDRQEYFNNLLKSGHGSVLEHGMFTFVFHNISRVATHELVRHRVGTAISQESLRFVRLTSLGFRVPDILSPLKDRIVEMVETLEEFQIEAAEKMGLDEEGLPFHVKKEVTSALRRLAPLGLSTGMVWSANVRTLRHVIEARTALGAEEEIRTVFDWVGRIMQREAPMLFKDYKVGEDGAWTTEFNKV